MFSKNKYIKAFLVLGAIVMMSGCSGKESILVPGQSESDCEGKAAQLGVCATPKNAYKYKDRIGKIWHIDGEGYYVNKSGRVFNVETNEEVFPGKKPDDCVDAICINCDDEGNIDDSSGVRVYSKGKKRNIRLQNRALVIGTPSKKTVIRDLGWQQKIWIAPMETVGDDFIEAHAIHVVIKKPSWIVGEKVPRNVKRGVVIPSVLATEVMTDNHEAIPRKSNKVIDEYVRKGNNKKYSSLRKYILKNKKEKNND